MRPYIFSLPSAARTAVALLLPFVTTAVQWLLWDAIRPFAWFLYFPTVFISSWLGSFRTGIIAAVVSALLAKYFFMPPYFSLSIESPMQLVNMLMFIGMGVFFSLLHERLRQAEQTVLESMHTESVRLTQERQYSDQKRLVSEYKYRMLAENAIDLVFWKESDGQYRYVSPASELITGYRPEEFMNDPELMIRIIHPEDREKYEEHIAHDAEPDDGDMDIRMVARDGIIHWVSHHCRPMYGSSGEYLGRHGTNRDITARKQAEDELKQHIEELERFNRASVGRELEMIRLKREINSLFGKLGVEPPYNLDFVDKQTAEDDGDAA